MDSRKLQFLANLEFAKRTFTQFPDLPLEIQTQIWHCAVPDPLSFVSVIPLHLNYDMIHLQALVPHLADLNMTIFYECGLEIVDGQVVEYNDRLVTGKKYHERAPIFDLMHCCRQSRAATRKTYRLLVDSIIEGEMVPFWQNPDDDVVYFPLSNAVEIEDERMMLWFLSNYRDKPLQGFDSLKNIAFRVGRALNASFGVTSHIGDEDCEFCWLENFPILESLILLFDPGDVQMDWNDGRIVLFEPLDVTLEERLFDGDAPDHFSRTPSWLCEAVSECWDGSDLSEYELF